MKQGCYNLIQNLRETSKDLNAVRRLSAAHTATSSCSVQVIGLAPGFNSLIKIHWMSERTSVAISPFPLLCTFPPRAIQNPFFFSPLTYISALQRPKSVPKQKKEDPPFLCTPQDGAPHAKQNKIKLKIKGKEKKLMKVMKLVIKWNMIQRKWDIRLYHSIIQ